MSSVRQLFVGCTRFRAENRSLLILIPLSTIILLLNLFIITFAHSFRKVACMACMYGILFFVNKGVIF